MLSFDISALSAKAAAVDGGVPADDPVWEEDDPRPVDAVHVRGRLSSAGGGRFFFSGHLAGRVASECRRCLTDLVVPVEERSLQLIFAPPGADEADEPDVYQYDPRARELDLRPAIREQWLLAVPAYAVCREDCKGLCATCGADLNAVACDCAPVATDSRWDALRALRGDQS